MDGNPVVVVWTGYRAGPWVCRSLSAAGWHVIGVQPGGTGSGRSTACFAPRPIPPVSDADGLIDALRAICQESGAEAVVAVDEDCVRLLAARGPDLAPARLVGPTADQYAALCDKGNLAASAIRVGLEHPANVVVGPGGPAGAWPPLPGVVKTRGSASPMKGVDSVVRVATAEARDAAVGRLIDAGMEALVEEFVAATQWSVHCVRWEDGTFRAVAGRVVRTLPRGAGMPSVLEVGAADEPAAEAAGRLLESVGYIGAANVQFFMRDGRLLVHDVNLRIPAGVAMSMRCGLDLPALGLAAGLGRPGRMANGPDPGIEGFRYVSLVDELRGLRDGARRAVGHDLVRSALGRDAILDPPLRDPLWMAENATTVARRMARRVLRGGPS